MKFEHYMQMVIEDPEKAIIHDFREEIINFEKLEYKIEEKPIDHFIIYQASGYKTYSKDKNVEMAARKMLRYRDRGAEIGEEEKHADACYLIIDIYDELWSEEHRKLAPIGDTMNSCNTTINRWLETKLKDANLKKTLKDINEEKCAELGEKVHDYFFFNFEGENPRWATVRSILLYDAKPKWFRGLLGEAKEFLSVAYTVGNFIPCPKACNSPRGFRNPVIKDYWDLTLWYIYLWYKYKADKLLEKIVRNKYVQYKKWLDSFDSWDDFVEWDTKPYGRPKEFWDGHFTGAVLPKTDEQIKAFFTHAAESIKARSERMVKALREKAGE